MTKDDKATVALLWNDPRFKLTGSRYWNQLNPNLITLDETTDVDFVANHDESTIRYLSSVGFRGKMGNYIEASTANIASYSDGWTTVVMYLGNVQVIFKNNLTLYLKVQASIGPEFYYHYLWKKNGNSTENIQAMLAYLYSIEEKRLWIL